MGRGGTSRRATLPTVVTDFEPPDRAVVYHKRLSVQPLLHDDALLAMDAERFVLVTESLLTRAMAITVPYRRVQCHAQLTDAMTAALPLFHCTDTFVRLVDLGPPVAGATPRLVRIQPWVWLQHDDRVERPREEWPARRNVLAQRENARPDGGVALEPNAPWVLITQGVGGTQGGRRTKRAEGFFQMTDACARIKTLLSRHEMFVGLWDLAGGDAPVLVRFGLHAQVDSEPAAVVWAT